MAARDQCFIVNPPASQKLNRPLCVHSSSLKGQKSLLLSQGSRGFVHFKATLTSQQQKGRRMKEGRGWGGSDKQSSSEAEREAGRKGSAHSQALQAASGHALILQTLSPGEEEKQMPGTPRPGRH